MYPGVTRSSRSASAATIAATLRRSDVRQAGPQQPPGVPDQRSGERRHPGMQVRGHRCAAPSSTQAARAHRGVPARLGADEPTATARARCALAPATPGSYAPVESVLASASASAPESGAVGRRTPVRGMERAAAVQRGQGVPVDRQQRPPRRRRRGCRAAREAGRQTRWHDQSGERLPARRDGPAPDGHGGRGGDAVDDAPARPAPRQRPASAPGTRSSCRGPGAARTCSRRGCRCACRPRRPTDCPGGGRASPPTRAGRTTPDRR